MTGFVSFSSQLDELLDQLVPQPTLHSRWLNTLSYLENCGARQIARCEHPTLVRREVLKHAAEEFRHAYYLKSQLNRVSDEKLPDYQLPSLLGGIASLHYLRRLDLEVCRTLVSTGILPAHLKPTAYVLVTFAIEKRAQELYPVYQRKLKKHRSPVSVLSIIREEEAHLEEMEHGLTTIPQGDQLAVEACTIEARIFDNWLARICHHLKDSS